MLSPNNLILPHIYSFSYKITLSHFRNILIQKNHSLFLLPELLSTLFVRISKQRRNAFRGRALIFILVGLFFCSCFLPNQIFANHLQNADLALLTVLVPDEGDSNPHLSGRTPLILIHGIHGNQQEDETDDINNPNRGYWQRFIMHFYNSSNLNKAYKLYRFHYVSDKIDVDHISQGLRYWINLAFGTNRPIVILAHSMGGLVARSYMNSYGGGERVLKLITLATPHHGTPGANSQSRDELATDSNWAL